jgi:hypothetical protein
VKVARTVLRRERRGNPPDLSDAHLDKLCNMIFDPKIFYQTYLKDYHRVKATYLKKILDDLPKYELDFFGKELDEEEKAYFRRTLKSDLRQTYFHAIETFFELFFALNPKGRKKFDDLNILYNLTNSEGPDTYSRITQIAENENSLEFLDEKIKFMGYEISIGHYLFYMGIFKAPSLSEELQYEINQSIQAVKYGIKIIASDFIHRQEYNAYKHGLRIIPATKAILFAKPETKEIKFKFDLNDSMSFYLKSKSPNELKIITKLFDIERDYAMTMFCSRLIHHLIFYRRMTMKFDKDAEKYPQFPITFFGKEPIAKCDKVNVSIQDIEYTVTMTDYYPDKSPQTSKSKIQKKKKKNKGNS